MRYLRYFFLYRWCVFIIFLYRKVRFHPSAFLLGEIKKFHFDKNVKIGANVRLSVKKDGVISLGKNVWVSYDVEMDTSSKIIIEAQTTIQRRVTINGVVTIGKGCIIAPNVFISSGTHPFREYTGKTIREQEGLIIKEKGSLDSLNKPIIIGDDCWIGVNVVICPGVRIGNGCVIGANSVVTKNIEDNTVVAGVPAKFIGNRF